MKRKGNHYGTSYLYIHCKKLHGTNNGKVQQMGSNGNIKENYVKAEFTVSGNLLELHG